MTAEQHDWWYCWCHHTKFMLSRGVVSRSWIGVSDRFTSAAMCSDNAQEKMTALGSGYRVLWPIAAATPDEAIDKFIEHFRSSFS